MRKRDYAFLTYLQTGCATERILTIYMSYDEFPRKGVPFEGRIETGLNFGVKYPQKTSWVVNRHFRA